MTFVARSIVLDETSSLCHLLKTINTYIPGSVSQCIEECISREVGWRSACLLFQLKMKTEKKMRICFFVVVVCYLCLCE